MKRMINWMKQLPEDRLYELAALLDGELERRHDKAAGRAYQRSSFMSDIVQAKRMAPRQQRLAA
jgi:hypothetical protein